MRSKLLSRCWGTYRVWDKILLILSEVFKGYYCRVPMGHPLGPFKLDRSDFPVDSRCPSVAHLMLPVVIIGGGNILYAPGHLFRCLLHVNVSISSRTLPFAVMRVSSLRIVADP